MATAKTPDVEPNLTECAVCNDTFTVPKLLPCSHILCRHCLVRWLQSQPQAACPLCRCAIVDPERQGGRSVEEVADGFPTDLAMTAMVEAETLLSKQHVCCVCDNVAAVALCLQCGDTFCQHCCNVHTRQSATKHHRVEMLSLLTTEKLASYHPDTCQDHEKKVSKFYCATHGTTFCTLCATTAHRSCPELVPIHTRMGELTAELFQLDDVLAGDLAKADDSIRLLDAHVQDLETQSAKALVEIKKVCDQLKASIDARLLHIKNATVKLVSGLAKRANALKNSLMNKRSKIITHKKMTELYLKFTEHKQFKDMIAIVKSRMHEFDKICSIPDDLKLTEKLVVTVDEQSVARMKKRISLLGNISLISVCTESKDQASSTSKVVIDKESAVKQRQSGRRFDPITATPSAGVAVRTCSQGDNRFSEISCLTTSSSSEELFVADAASKSIAIISLKSDRLISTLSLDEEPYEMTLLGDSQLAVTTGQKVIILVDISNRQKPPVRKKIATSRSYYGLTADTRRTDSIRLYVGCFEPACVDMLTVTGHVIKTVVSSESVPALRSPWYLQADPQRDVLYVSDYDSQSVFLLSLSTGTPMSELAHPRLRTPGQVRTDSAGNLYVASTAGQCLLVLSTGGEWREMLTGERHGEEGKVQPLGFCVTDTGLVVNWYPGAIKRYDCIAS